MQKNFIFSDTETTGLREKDFIQIIQSASILTDESFERIDAQNIESRPLPWVVPQPGAYLVHKKISSLDSNISHYQMMKDIYDTWEKWSDDKQSIFITYNGHQFDEELYRRQFYWNLLPPYITNTNGNGRSDLYFLILLVLVGAILLNLDLQKRTSYKIFCQVFTLVSNIFAPYIKNFEICFLICFILI